MQMWEYITRTGNTGTETKCLWESLKIHKISCIALFSLDKIVVTMPSLSLFSFRAHDINNRTQWADLHETISWRFSLPILEPTQELDKYIAGCVSSVVRHTLYLEIHSVQIWDTLKDPTASCIFVSSLFLL